VAGLSQGTIKAIEQGKTDARLSTLRKLARTFTAHGVEFVMEGSRNGVTIKNDKPAQVGRALEGASPTRRIAAEAGGTTSIGNSPKGNLWLHPFRAVRSKKV
jgi:DNA-binding XRE family transcriptional regulator